MKSRECRFACALILCLGLLAAPASAQVQQEKAPAPAKINLNTATVEQLQSLPGVGPALAERIVAYRTKIGKFGKVEEILNVQGIGEKKFQQLKDRLTV